MCSEWSVEDVVAHLTAAATIGRLRWMTSMLGARFDADRHNLRRLREQRGPTPADTLRGFRATVDNTIAPTGHLAALLGEVVVHGQDIRRPLGLDHEPPVETVTSVARFFAARDFAVASHSMADHLALTATDGPFAVGHGPSVRGPTLALTMTMAGRDAWLGELSGPGVSVLRFRLDERRST